MSPELQTAMEPLLVALEPLSEQTRDYNERIEKLAEDSYSQVGC